MDMQLLKADAKRLTELIIGFGRSAKPKPAGAGKDA